MNKDKKHTNIYWNKPSKKWYGMISKDKMRFKTIYSANIEDVIKDLDNLKEKLKSRHFIENYKASSIKEYGSYTVTSFERINFQYSYTGAEGQKVYTFKGYIKEKFYNIEMVEHPEKGWAYHAETKKMLICDSRISNKYYDNIEDCKKGLIKSFKRINNLKSKNKTLY